jgi:hypothetical protein
MRLFGPLLDRATYRRWVYFILGGALSVPYLLSAAAVPSLVPFVTTLDDPVPGVTFGPAGGWPVRLRSSAMSLLHVGTGCVLSLVVPVFFGFAVVAPFTGEIALSTEDPIRVPKAGRAVVGSAGGFP